MVLMYASCMPTVENFAFECIYLRINLLIKGVVIFILIFSLNRISPSKLSLCTSKEPNGLTSLEQIPAGSESSGSHKEDVRSISSDEFLAMERSAELEEPLPPPEVTFKEQDNHITGKII